MSRYFVIKQRKITSDSDYKNTILGHNNRERHYQEHTHKNIKSERTKDNIILQAPLFRNEKEIRDFANANKGKGRRQLQKGRAFGFEFVVDCSVMPNWNEDDYITYLRDAEAFFKQRFQGFKGGNQLLSSVIHLDEGKPHLHIAFSYFDTEIGAWNQKQLKKQYKSDMNSILDDFQEAIGEKYGLIRGNGAELKKELMRDIKPQKVDVVVDVEKGFIKEKVITEKKFVIEEDDLNKALKANNKYLRTLKNERYYHNEIEKVNVIKKELKSKSEEIETLNKDKETLQNELNNANSTIQELSNKNNELSSKLDKVNENKEEVKRAKTILQKFKLLSKNNEELSKRNDELSSKVYNYNSLKNEINELKSSNNFLQNRYNELSSVMKDKNKKIEEQEEEIEDYETKFEALQQEFKQYKQIVYRSVVEPIREALNEVNFTSIKNKITELYEYKKSQEQDYDYDLVR